MDERLVKAAREGDVNALHNLLKEDPLILQKASSVHFADSPLHVAALSGKAADFVKQIVTQKPSLATETNQQGMIPLHLASLEGHVLTVRELLKAQLGDGVMNQCLVKDDEGRTPLHCASQKGKIMVMKELIRECPECLQQVTAKGETVLHLAAKANQVEAVKVIVESTKGLPNFQTLVKAKDINGKTVYDLAAAKKQLQVLELLKEDDEIREESRINLESESEASKKEENSKESESRQNAVLVMATLIITLTYQALVNPPSTFLKEGRTRIEWSCLNQGSPKQGLIKAFKECPANLALLFIIYNTMIFFTSIYVVVCTLRARNVFSMRFLTLLLTLCYSCLLTAVYYKAVYFAFPMAFLAIALFLLSRIDYGPVSSTIITYLYRKLYSTLSKPIYAHIIALSQR